MKGEHNSEVGQSLLSAISVCTLLVVFGPYVSEYYFYILIIFIVVLVAVIYFTSSIILPVAHDRSAHPKYTRQTNESPELDSLTVECAENTFKQVRRKLSAKFKQLSHKHVHMMER